MSVSELSNAGFNWSLLNQGKLSNQSPLSGTGSVGSSSASDFAATLTLQLANFQSQTLGSLMSSAFGADNVDSSSSFSALLTSPSASSAAQTALSASGRNTALFDPESAYQMMSVINSADVTYKAQFSELSQMKSYVAEMRLDGESLGSISASTGNDSIKAQLQTFANQYNDWAKRFDADMQQGGVLADTQAAQVSRYELDQSIENVFNGAKDGLHGLRDLGFTIDPNTKLATLDTAKLDSVLASNRQGVVDTVQEFSANFVKSAALLNSDGNFIPNRLANLDRVIDYIADNKTSLQAEFGMGDSAKPSAQVAKALAAYKQTYGV
jgi:hypothetical protein